MNRSTLWFSLGVLTLVGAGVGVWRTTTETAAREREETEEETEAELLALKGEIRALKRVMRQSQERAVAPVPSPLPFAPPQAPLPAPSQRDEGSYEEPPIVSPQEFEEVMRARAEDSLQNARARRARIDGTLEAEIRDSNWAIEAENTIEGWQTEPKLEGATFSEIDCRSSICRVHITLPEGKQIEDFMVATMQKMGTFQTTSLHLADPNGNQREFVAYLGREGLALPQ